MDLTPREIYNKIRELKLDSVTSHSLHAVVMAVIHSDADRDSYFMNADTFLESGFASVNQPAVGSEVYACLGS